MDQMRKRQVWTVCFGLVWVVILIALIVMHVTTASAVASLQAFPANLVQGFDGVFGFAKLQVEAQNMKDAAETAIGKCSVPDPATYCQANENGNICNRLGANTQNVDASQEKQAVVDAFDRGLANIRKVGKNKYLGFPTFYNASVALDEVQAEMEKIQANGPCCATTELFCGIRKQSEDLINMAEWVSGLVYGLTYSMEGIGEYASQLAYVHAVPWFLVVSEIFFAILWWKNGACCCCSNGTLLQTLILVVPQVLLWEVAFLVGMAFTAIGYLWDSLVLSAVLPFPNEPTVEDLLNNIYAEFPDFYKLVFAPLASSGSSFVTGSMLLTNACVFAIYYSCLFCYFRPYGTGKSEEGVANKDDTSVDL